MKIGLKGAIDDIEEDQDLQRLNFDKCPTIRYAFIQEYYNCNNYSILAFIDPFVSKNISRVKYTKS